MYNLGSPTKDGPQASCFGSMESYPLGRKKVPAMEIIFKKDERGNGQW